MRHVLRSRQITTLLAEGVDKLRFVVVKEIPTGGGQPPLAAGQDITDLVRSGAIPEGPLHTHLRRGFVIAKPADDKAGVDLLRKATWETGKGAQRDADQQRKALEAAGVPVAPGAGASQRSAARKAALATSKAAKRPHA